jgi:hypothetical protein
MDDSLPYGVRCKDVDTAPLLACMLPPGDAVTDEAQIYSVTLLPVRGERFREANLLWKLAGTYFLSIYSVTP